LVPGSNSAIEIPEMPTAVTQPEAALAAEVVGVTIALTWPAATFLETSREVATVAVV
jgi:hypothetical protein